MPRTERREDLAYASDERMRRVCYEVREGVFDAGWIPEMLHRKGQTVLSRWLEGKGMELVRTGGSDRRHTGWWFSPRVTHPDRDSKPVTFC